MRTRVIRQGVSADSLFKILLAWCNKGAGHRRCRLRILSAFASGGGVSAILPLVDVFLSDGNSLEIIIGIDRNGTDRGAIEHLNTLLHTYPTQCSVSVFHAPSRESIFHPKLYIYDAPGRKDFVLGSANLTGGGLGANFESLVFFEDCRRSEPMVRIVEELWRIFASPVSPLRGEFLKELSGGYYRSLLKSLPRKQRRSDDAEGKTFQLLWKSLSRVPLQKSTKPRIRRSLKAGSVGSQYLLMDVLNETRKTQMQLPIPIVREFFCIDAHEPLDLNVSIYTKSGLTQPIHRPLVLSQGKKGQNLMRRIEMPQIRNLERPLAVLFIKLSGRRRYAFKLFPRASRAFGEASDLLADVGQQGGAERRYLIGRSGDRNWRTIAKLMKV